MKYLKHFAFSSILLMFIYGFASPEKDVEAAIQNGIQFHQGSWEDALQLAKKENRLIFLDIYASWCGPCKQLKKSTFPHPMAGEYYNKNFVNVALDGEQKEGSMLAQKYKITAYPTLLFLDIDGKELGRAVGYHSPQELVELGQKYAQ